MFSILKILLISTFIHRTNSFLNGPLKPVPHQEIGLKNLIKGIENKQFDNIYFSPDLRKVTVSSPDYDIQYDTTITPLITEKLVDVSIQNDVEPFFINYQPNLLSNFSSLFFPIMIFLIFRNILTFNTMMGGQGNNQFTNSIFGINKPPIKTKVETNVTFADWAGSKEVLEECTEFVTYLKNDTFYKNVGAQIPKGILLEGPPGTGKTLLAKAIATESNCSFISISGSEFVEMFVGVGAMRVRKLFEEARSNLPCILFIDEIDAIGKQRGGNSFLGGNDEREQTLNQLLTEMDGFNKNEGIITIAATNRIDILDNALLRPGRFDRIIRIPLPDTDSREAIIKVHLKDKKIDSTVNIKDIAKMTVGFSGAKLNNLVNEASILAARNQKDIITNEYFYEAIEKLMVGIKKKVDTRDFETRKRIAIHELGHGFIANYFTEYFELQKITMQASYSGAGGYTIYSEKYDIAENGLYTKDLLLKKLMIGLGGKAAETVFYGEEFVSLGATMDLKQINALAKEMIEKYGMGNKLQVFYKDDIFKQSYSQMTESQIDKEVSILVNEAFIKAKELIEQHKHIIEQFILILMNSVTMTGEEFNTVLHKIV